MSPLPPHLAVVTLLDHDGDTMGQSQTNNTSITNGEYNKYNKYNTINFIDKVK